MNETELRSHALNIAVQMVLAGYSDDLTAEAESIYRWLVGEEAADVDAA